MKQTTGLSILIISAIFMASCGQIPVIPTIPSEITINMNGDNQQGVDEIVAATFQALTAQAAAPQPALTFTPIPTLAIQQVPTATSQPQAAPNASTGSISGKLSYPAEGIPPLLLVAFNKQSGYYYWLLTLQNQNTYQLDNLPPGIYNVIAYTQDGSIKGSYDQFVLCGLQQGCSDHTLVDVNVQAGLVTPNVDPADWYGDPASLPAKPDIDLPQNGNANQNGFISGTLTYPAGGLPAMVIVAYHVGGGPADYYYVATALGQNSYQIEVPAGDYNVVAYSLAGGGFPGGLSGGYSQAVPCGLSVSCTDHSLIKVTVLSQQSTGNITPGDWYAPGGSFPSNPIP